MSYETDVCRPSVTVDPEELQVFKEAIADPVVRDKIISILEEAGLLDELLRQPA